MFKQSHQRKEITSKLAWLIKSKANPTIVGGGLSVPDKEGICLYYQQGNRFELAVVML
jgi:hypothetical protein